MDVIADVDPDEAVALAGQIQVDLAAFINS